MIEFDNLKRMVDKLIREFDYKTSTKDLDNHVINCKSTFEEIKKEILLKANIKDLIPLLDSKANI